MKMETEILNAKISKTYLGFEDHGIYTCYLTLDFDGYVQSFGGYFLESYSDMIQNILKAVGVDSWESLTGKYVRVKKGTKYSSPIVSIGHIVNDVWYSPEDKK